MLAIVVLFLLLCSLYGYKSELSFQMQGLISKTYYLKSQEINNDLIVHTVMYSVHQLIGFQMSAW